MPIIILDSHSYSADLQTMLTFTSSFSSTIPSGYRSRPFIMVFVKFVLVRH